jgi:hypothetical protein
MLSFFVSFFMFCICMLDWELCVLLWWWYWNSSDRLYVKIHLGCGLEYTYAILVKQIWLIVTCNIKEIFFFTVVDTHVFNKKNACIYLIRTINDISDIWKTSRHDLVGGLAEQNRSRAMTQLNSLGDNSGYSCYDAKYDE